MTSITVIGTLKNIPVIPQIAPQNERARKKKYIQGLEQSKKDLTEQAAQADQKLTEISAII